MPSAASSRFQIYTDGGADPNPGPAGWGAVILDQETDGEREISGGAEHSTNNRMELTAAIRALQALPEGAEATVHTDSIYLKKGVTEWLPRWISRGWRRRTGELSNEDLWRELAGLAAGRRVHWRWVKGHAGHRYNERADRLAAAEIQVLRARRKDLPPGSIEQRTEMEAFLRVSGGGERGGWAALVCAVGDPGGDLRIGSVRGATANELELMAAAEVLESLPAGVSVAIHTGSDYLRHGATRWLDGWRARGWRTKAGAPVQNRAAWERLVRATAGRRVIWPELRGDLPKGWKELGSAAREAAAQG
ncbi:MAG TPA: ribonuclease HI [Thermoanaerobaculia bacterium]|nr:ribonuclease HI [Thermoanaerobaculia bacterium]